MAKLFTLVRTNGAPSRTVTGFKLVMHIIHFVIVIILARVMSKNAATTHLGAMIPTTEPTVTQLGTSASSIWSSKPSMVHPTQGTPTQAKTID